MGLLEDAIREHLDLMRRTGSNPAEIARMEHEALGPPQAIGATARPAAPEVEEHPAEDLTRAQDPLAGEHPLPSEDALAGEHPLEGEDALAVEHPLEGGAATPPGLEHEPDEQAVQHTPEEESHHQLAPHVDEHHGDPGDEDGDEPGDEHGEPRRRWFRRGRDER